MAPLKVLGIDQFTKWNVIQAIFTLLLFSVSSSGIYDLIKLFPTIFIPEFNKFDWMNVSLDITPSIIFFIWSLFLWWWYLKRKTDTKKIIINDSIIPAHRGIVMALSKPRQTPDEICKLISDTSKDELQLLYSIQSIGQSFKALYHHREKLIHVWLIRTKSSDPYDVCIKAFLGKFVKNAHIRTEINNIITTESDAEVIDQTKHILSKIYSMKNLSEFNLKASDVIVDITGGTRTIGVGLTFGALCTSINIQYVEQRSEENRIIPLSITPEIILDKIGEYLLEKYAEIMKRKQMGINVLSDNSLIR
jgi:hypothetical protein